MTLNPASFNFSKAELAKVGRGAGGTAIKWLSGLTPGSTLTVTVGSGSTGVSNAPGNTGTASTVAAGTHTVTTLTGGGGSAVAGGAGASGIVIFEWVQ